MGHHSSGTTDDHSILESLNLQPNNNDSNDESEDDKIRKEVESVLDDIVLQYYQDDTSSLDSIEESLRDVSFVLQHIHQENQMVHFTKQLDEAVLNVANALSSGEVSPEKIVEVEICAKNIHQLQQDMESNKRHLMALHKTSGFIDDINPLLHYQIDKIKHDLASSTPNLITGTMESRKDYTKDEGSYKATSTPIITNDDSIVMKKLDIETSKLPGDDMEQFKVDSPQSNQGDNENSIMDSSKQSQQTMDTGNIAFATKIHEGEELAKLNDNITSNTVSEEEIKKELDLTSENQENQLKNEIEEQYLEINEQNNDTQKQDTIVNDDIEQNMVDSTKRDAQQTRENETDENVEPITLSDDVEDVDVAIVGAGIGGLCAGAILNTLYGKKVGIYESHYLAGGCAHAFDRPVEKDGKKVTFTFDSGPTIVLGCSSKPYNPLRQVLNVIGLGDEVDWIPYDGWGMIENPGNAENEERWRVELGPNVFQQGPLCQFGDEGVLKEFEELRKATKGLVSGAIEIPAMAMRSGKSALVPLMQYLPALIGLIQQGPEITQGTFAPFMDGPKFVVKDKWLRNWLDALAFSLSGLPACRTSAAAMAYVLYDMHREGASLDYPKGGLGNVIDALVKGVEQGDKGSKVHLRSHVQSIETSKDGSRVLGLRLKNGKMIKAKDGVICNAPVWSLNNLIQNDLAKLRLNYLMKPKKKPPTQSWSVPSDPTKERSSIKFDQPLKDNNTGAEAPLLEKCDTSEMTGSFLHLHLALDATGLDLDSLEAHYTVMDRGLSGDGSFTTRDDGVKVMDGPCGELNMVAVSNPCVLDRNLAPEGYIVVHAYGAGNEPYDIWKDLTRNSPEYLKLKEERSQVLWRAVESIIPDVRERIVTDLVGSPITHERFLRRPRGTYGSATEDYLKDGSTPLKGLVLAGDGIFPGIGVPAVALSGASAANSMVDPVTQWACLKSLKKKGVI